MIEDVIKTHGGSIVNQNDTVEQHALGQSLLLHLLPGVLTAGAILP